MTHARQVVCNYLTAVRQTRGADYVAKMVVDDDEAGNVRVRHPDDREEELVPLDHLEQMTKQLLSEPRH